MSQTNPEFDKFLDEYLYDYLVKRNLHTTAEAFRAEGNVSTNPVAINPPGGFLLKWWFTFWDMFIASSNVNLSEMAPIYNENDTQLVMPQQQQGLQMQQMFNQSHVQQQQQQHQQMYHQSHAQKQQELQMQMQMQEMLYPKQQQHQFQNPALENIDNAAMQQMMSNTTMMSGQLLDPIYASMLKGQTLHGTSGNIQLLQNLNQQLPLSANIGLDQLQPGFLQDESLMSYQSFNQLQLQQQVMLQAQQNSILPSANDWESRMLLNNPNVGSSVQLPLMPEMQQQQLQNMNPQQQLWMRYPPQQQRKQDIWAVPGGMTEYEQAPKRQAIRKDKQVMSSSGPAKTAGPAMSLSSPPSTNWTDRLGLLHIDDAEDDIREFTLTEAQVLLLHASTSEVECCDISYDGKFIATGGRDNKVVIWLLKSRGSYSMKSTLEEHSQCVTAVRFCPVLFSRLATASADKTVKVWDAENPGKPLCTFTGHSSPIMSVDFYLTGRADNDLVCSSDESAILYWNATNGSFVGRIEGSGAKQIRLQSPSGGGCFLAAAHGNIVDIHNADGKKFLHRLEGHNEEVECIRWDHTGDYLASVSEDMIRVWKFDSGAKVDCIQMLTSHSGNKFHTCVFHPSYSIPVMLVIGCHKGLEFWNMSKNKRTRVFEEEEVVSEMAVSNLNVCFVTVRRGMYVKLWT